MLIEKAYKTELDPNKVQRTSLIKHAGTARFAYNWGLRRKQESYRETGKSPNAIALHRELNRLKQTELTWMYDVSKCAPQEALRNLDQAFINFFAGRAKYPKYKSRKRGIGTFRLTGLIKVGNSSVQLPRIGVVQLKEHNYIPTDKHVLSATVSEKAGRWFVSVLVREEIDVPANNGGPTVGVDLGIAKLATVSDGTVIQNPHALVRHERKKKHLQRELARKKKGSKNRADAQRKLARCEMRIANIRRDALHKATTWLTKTKSVIVVEDLAVQNMMKNHHLAKSLADAGLGEFRRQLTYKASWYGCRLIAAARAYPSTKCCSACGAVKASMRLSERVYQCERCGMVLDRDLNAARNLESLASVPPVAGSWPETLNACVKPEVHAYGQVPADDPGTEHLWGEVPNG